MKAKKGETWQVKSTGEKLKIVVANDVLVGYKTELGSDGGCDSKSFYKYHENTEKQLDLFGSESS